MGVGSIKGFPVLSVGDIKSEEIHESNTLFRTASASVPEKAWRFFERYLSANEEKILSFARANNIPSGIKAIHRNETTGGSYKVMQDGYEACRYAYGAAMLVTEVALFLSREAGSLSASMSAAANPVADALSNPVQAMRIAAYFGLDTEKDSSRDVPHSPVAQHANYHNAAVGFQIGMNYVNELIRRERLADAA